ncbi:MAG: heparinase II/III family protein [Planctomycetes bacterium]|nr:heparinase II/III family protein [Planctomycetota bacterium]
MACSGTLALALSLALAGAPETPENPLEGLRAGHPRLILLDETLPALRRAIADDATAKGWYEEIRRRAEDLLDADTVEYKIVGPRLLAQSRRCLDRVYTLALVFRIDGERRFAERARKELFAAAAFPDWNPSHFLDTAEMSHAFAIGYDWLHAFLSVEDRARIREALVSKGLKAAEPVYAKNSWWARATHNWNQVCNGGIGIGALAVADEERALASSLLSSALKSIPRALASYAPDGGWNEGPGYWHYATRYTVHFLASLETALGKDFGLCAMPGLAETGLFWIHAVSPIDRLFNYADCGERAGGASEMLWLARRFRQPIFAWHERTRARGGDPLDIAWYAPQAPGPIASKLPRDAFFRGIDVVFLRGAWEDRDASYVGFKGGDNRANHSHLDLGTFVLDALGERWALDLGGDDYNMPGYFGRERWTYYRLRTEGHNVITIDGANQNPAAKSPIVAFVSTPDRAHGVADLSKAYAAAKGFRRGVALLDRKSVLIQDEIDLDGAHDLAWAMHTRAEIAADGNRAMLRIGGKRLAARILEPAGAEFVVRSASAPKPQNPNRGVRKLVIERKGAAGAQRFAVWLVPLREGEEPPERAPAVTPLPRWEGGK